MDINLDNLKKVITMLEEMDPHSFCYEYFMYVKDADCPEGYKADKTCQQEFIETGEVACGTLLCLAGSIYVNFSDDETREMGYEAFSTMFLELDSDDAYRLFIDSRTYGQQDSNEVTLEMVLEKLKSIAGL